MKSYKTQEITNIDQMTNVTRGMTQYSERLKSGEEVNFLTITISNSQRKVNKSIDTKETVGFSQGKLGCVFHVLFVFHY